jgi:transposase-like protein DUF772
VLIQPRQIRLDYTDLSNIGCVLFQQDWRPAHVYSLGMQNVVRIERKTTSEFDTAVRSLSTLRNPVAGERPGPESRTLLGDVQQAVRSTMEGDLRRVAPVQAGLAFQPKGLLSLLVYCYTTGTFSSADIEDLMRRDANFRNFCNGEFPSACVLKRFRRENRMALRDCLQAVLQRQSQRRGPPDGLMTAARQEEALMEEADGRILKAMFIDSMEAGND